MSVLCLPFTHLCAENVCASMLLIHVGSLGGMPAGRGHWELIFSLLGPEAPLPRHVAGMRAADRAKSRGPGVRSAMQMTSHVPPPCINAQGLSPVGQSLLLRRLTCPSASVQRHTFVQGRLGERLYLLDGMGWEWERKEYVV